MREVAEEEKIKFCLQTNGILMNAQNISSPIRKKMTWVNVSVDAATSETYLKVRRGGKWSALMNNIQWMNEEIVRGQLESMQGWQLNFVVQEENYHEIPKFIDWALELSSKPKVWFNLIDDWGHLPNKEFQRKAIWRSSHPQHPQVIYGNMLTHLQ